MTRSINKTNKYFAVVPVYNEEKNIKSFLNKLNKQCKNIIVVNDGSTDNTLEIVKKIKYIHLINLKRNSGKGFAMKMGANLAWKMKADAVIFMDGDNQHNPKHLPKFFEYLNKPTDIVIGIRKVKANIPFIRRIGNNIFMTIMYVLFDIRITDILCGFRAVSKRGYRSLEWESNDYGVETEMLTIIGRKRLDFKTVVVDTIYLDKYKGFSAKNGLEILLKIPKWKFRKI